MVGEAHLHTIKSHNHQVGDPQTGKYLFSRGSPMKMRVLSVTLGSQASLGVCHQEEDPQSIWL